VRVILLTIRRLDLVNRWAAMRPSFGLRRAVAVMFVIFLVSDLVAAAIHLPALAGFGFAAGSAAAAGWTRQRDLIMVVTTPPVIYFGAVIFGDLVTMHLGHVPMSVGLIGASILLTLAASAPWLFGGLAGAIAIACVRGLPQCVRDLRAELLGRAVRDY